MNYNYNPYPQPYRVPYGQIQQIPAPGQQPVPQPIPQQIVQPQQPGYICRPVASEDEARAVPTDFSGATQILVDTAHGMIYTKGLNYSDGSAVFLAYRLVQPPAETQSAPSVEYAPMSAVDRLREDLEALRASIAEKRTPTRKAVSEQ